MQRQWRRQRQRQWRRQRQRQISFQSAATRALQAQHMNRLFWHRLCAQAWGMPNDERPWDCAGDRAEAPTRMHRLSRKTPEYIHTDIHINACIHEGIWKKIVADVYIPHMHIYMSIYIWIYIQMFICTRIYVPIGAKQYAAPRHLQSLKLIYHTYIYIIWTYKYMNICIDVYLHTYMCTSRGEARCGAAGASSVAVAAVGVLSALSL